jgi:hypothetical protein
MTSPLRIEDPIRPEMAPGGMETFRLPQARGELVDRTPEEVHEYSTGANADLIQVMVGLRPRGQEAPRPIRALVDTGCIPTGISERMMEELGYIFRRRTNHHCGCAPSWVRSSRSENNFSVAHRSGKDHAGPFAPGKPLLPSWQQW